MRVGEVRDDPGAENPEDGAEPVKGTSTSLIAVIAILACVLVVVLVGGFILYRRSKTSGNFLFRCRTTGYCTSGENYSEFCFHLNKTLYFLDCFI